GRMSSYFRAPPLMRPRTIARSMVKRTCDPHRIGRRRMASAIPVSWTLTPRYLVLVGLLLAAVGLAGCHESRGGYYYGGQRGLRLPLRIRLLRAVWLWLLRGLSLWAELRPGLQLLRLRLLPAPSFSWPVLRLRRPAWQFQQSSLRPAVRPAGDPPEPQSGRHAQQQHLRQSPQPAQRHHEYAAPHGRQHDGQPVVPQPRQSLRRPCVSFRQSRPPRTAAPEPHQDHRSRTGTRLRELGCPRPQPCGQTFYPQV